jgi:hypothetical protein
LLRLCNNIHFYFSKLKVAWVSCLAKPESTQIMKTQTEIQTVNPKDSALMIPPPSGVLSKTAPPKVLPKTTKK